VIDHSHITDHTNIRFLWWWWS